MTMTDEEVKQLGGELKDLTKEIGQIRTDIALIKGEIEHFKLIPEQLRQMSDTYLLQPQACAKILSEQFISKQEFKEVKDKANRAVTFIDNLNTKLLYLTLACGFGLIGFLLQQWVGA